MRRAQLSTEFLFVMGFVGFILFAYLLVVVVLQQDATSDEHLATAERIASEIRQEIITASVVMDGYTREFVIPTNIRNRAVSVQARPQAIIVRVGDQEAFLRTPEYQGSPNIGTNTIKKQDGVVVFT